MPNDYSMTKEEIDDLFANLHYDKNTGVFVWRRRVSRTFPGDIAGSVSTWGYIRICFKGRRFSAHRLGWFMSYGKWPNGELDHIDGNKKNNALSNLREVTSSINQILQPRPNSNNRTGVRGISLCRGRYRATLSKKYIGSFDTLEEASAAYELKKSEVLNQFFKGGQHGAE